MADTIISKIDSASPSCLSVEDDDSKHQLEVLLKEYELSRERLDRSDDRVVQVIGAGIALLYAVSTYLATQKSVSLGIAWIAPLLFIIFYAYLMNVFYFLLAEMYACRTMAQRINFRLSETALIRFEPDLPYGIFFSFKRGNIKHRLLYLTLLGSTVVLFIVTTTISASYIYEDSHWRGTSFVLLYSLLAAVELVAFSGLFRDLPDFYHRFLELEATKLKSGRQFATAEEFREHIPSMITIGRFLNWIIPRQWDLVVKGIYFWFGFFIAWVTFGLHPSQITLINALFGGESTWTDVTVPFLVVLALGVTYFAVEEGLLQQAKLLWNDIRDRDEDRALPGKRDRAVAKGVIDLATAQAHAVIRWLLALALGYALGGLGLLVLFILISLHQAIYELGPKPRAKSHPIWLLVILSPNVAFRFIAGAMVIVGSNIPVLPITYYFVLLCFFTVEAMPGIWRVEREKYEQDKEKREKEKREQKEQQAGAVSDGHEEASNETDQPEGVRADGHQNGDSAAAKSAFAEREPKPQGEYYKGPGRIWQYVGIIATFLSTGYMLVNQYKPLTVVIPFPQWSASGGSEVVIIAGVISNLGIGGAAISAVILITVFLVLAYGIAWLLSPSNIDQTNETRKGVRDTLSNIIKRKRAYFTIPLMLLTLILLSLSSLKENPIYHMWAMVSLCSYFAFSYEKMTFEEYYLEDLKRVLRKSPHLIRSLLFDKYFRLPQENAKTE